MNKEIVKFIPECIEKIGKFTPARHRETRKTAICLLSVSVLGGIFRYTFKEIMNNKKYEHEERMADKQYEHEERMADKQYEHEERMLEIKAKLSNREEESEDEKDN